MEWKTELGKHIYLYSEMKKFEPHMKMFEEIAQAFCVREKCKYLGIHTHDGVIIVAVEAPDESLYMHQLWQQSFTQMGWYAPLLDVHQPAMMQTTEEE